MKKLMPGINIQWPWSELLLEGKKTIETRSYPLPKRLENVEMAIIETPGPKGKSKAGIKSARVIGTITFRTSKQYTSQKAWLADQKKHLVNPNDPQFKYTANKEKWAWYVNKITILPKPIAPPKKRGIIYARPFSLDL